MITCAFMQLKEKQRMSDEKNFFMTNRDGLTAGLFDCYFFNLTSQQAIKQSNHRGINLTPECPFPHFFPGGFFTIHQYARAINLTGQPGSK